MDRKRLMRIVGWIIVVISGLFLGSYIIVLTRLSYMTSPSFVLYDLGLSDIIGIVIQIALLSLGVYLVRRGRVEETEE